MASQIGIGFGMQIVEAEHVYAGTEKHWALMKKLGGTEEQKKTFRGTIDHCRKVVLVVVDDQQPTLENTRPELKDSLGAMRVAGGLVANGMEGQDPVAERDLGLDKPFPANDRQMRALVAALPKAIKKYTAPLAERGFDKQEQARLIALCHQFLQLLKARGKERGDARAARAGREALFETLRHQTSYFRRLGRAALMNSAERADFDRVKRSPKQGKKAQSGQEASVAPSMSAPIAAVGSK